MVRRSSGQSSETSAAPMAHSPPMPTPARKRKIASVQMPVAKARQQREEGEAEDAEHHGAHAAEAIGDRSPDQRHAPADHEQGEEQAAVVADVRVGGRDSGARQKVAQRRNQHQRVDERVHAVHGPAAPGGPEAANLVRVQLGFDPDRLRSLCQPPAIPFFNVARFIKCEGYCSPPHLQTCRQTVIPRSAATRNLLLLYIARKADPSLRSG